MDSRHTKVADRLVEVTAEMLPAQIDRKVCDRWNKFYRAQRKSFTMHHGQERKDTSDNMGHTHMSAGLHTLVYACHFLRPERITLAGFDNVQSGGFTWSVTRGPDWHKYPDHNWATEREMIPYIEDHYQVQVGFL